jgi:8-oxo-dGTP pyrophosphatase MutT (NUDIX family)
MRAREFAEPQAAGCIIVAADTGRWCLQQRSNSVTDPGVWSTWGGGREPGESVTQCVRRELAEESGYQGPVELEPIDSNGTYATFLAHVPHEFEPELNTESQDYQWCDPDRLPEPLHPGLQQTLGMLSEVKLPKKHQHTEIIKHRVGDWVVYIDNHSVVRAMTRGIGPRMTSNLITAVAFIPDLENKVPIGGAFWIQDEKTNSSFYFKRLNVPSEPLAVRCETGVKDVPRAGSKTPVFKVNAYTGPELPEHEQAMKRAKLVNRFVGTDTMATTLARDIKKKDHPSIIQNPTTQDSKRYDRAFQQAKSVRESEWKEIYQIRSTAVTENTNPGLSYIGNCTEDEVVDDIFGNVSEFARMVELYGDEFAVGDLVVKYDDDQDIHYFYHKNDSVTENFADGKVKGKSRPGRVKRAGASCKGSVTDLRARAKKYSGERAKMYHWCANMKSGKKK